MVIVPVLVQMVIVAQTVKLSLNAYKDQMVFVNMVG